MFEFKLPEITYPFTPDTVGKTLAAGEGMSVVCNNYGCNRRTRINLVTVARLKSMDFPCMASDLRPLFFCRACRDAGRPDRNIGFLREIAWGQYSAWPRRDDDQ